MDCGILLLPNNKRPGTRLVLTAFYILLLFVITLSTNYFVFTEVVEKLGAGTDVTAPIVFTSDGQLRAGSLEKIVEWISSKQIPIKKQVPCSLVMHM